MAEFGLIVRVFGVKKLTKKLKTLELAIPVRMAGKINEAAHLVKATSQEKYLSAKGNVVRGRRGPRLVGKRTPHNRLGALTGRLRASIGISKAHPAKLFAEVGTNVFYGRIHELIGVGRAKFRRPFLGPALEDNRGRIVNLIGKEVSRLVARAN